MTTHDTALPARSLLDAVGGLIGFIPERSLVLITFDADGSVNATMRQDLALDAAGAPREEFLGVVDNLVTIADHYEIEAVVAIIIDDRHPPDSPQIARIVEQIDTRFAGLGGLAAAYAATEYAAGQRWHTVLTGLPSPLLVPPPSSGVFSDPESSPTALDRAFRRGRPVLRKRSAMVAMLDPTPHCTDPRCAPETLRPAEGLNRDEQSDLLAFAFESIAAMGNSSQSRPGRMVVSCGALVVWYRAITNLRVRDALLALAVTDLRGPAEQMWRALTSTLNGKGRASAATLLAHLHYIAGEGAYAGVALDVALAADPDWSFAVLLDRALRSGVRPSMLWEVIEDSYRVAADLGVALPEETLPIAG